MRNLDDLLEEAKWGRLTEEEIQYVASQIKECKPADSRNLYTLLHILGKATAGNPMAAQYRNLVEGFLVYPSDSMISRIAFVVLCNYWDLDKEYLPQMKAFIRGVDWDDDDVRLVAISSAGEYLRKTFDRDLLELLIQTFEGNSCSSREGLEVEDVARETAYSALARADGREWDQIPPPSLQLIKLLKRGQLDLSVVEHAKAKLQK